MCRMYSRSLGIISYWMSGLGSHRNSEPQFPHLQKGALQGRIGMTNSRCWAQGLARSRSRWRAQRSLPPKPAFFIPPGLTCAVQSGWKCTGPHFQATGHKSDSNQFRGLLLPWGVQTRGRNWPALLRDDLWGDSSSGPPNLCFTFKQARMMAPLTLIQRNLCPALKICPQQLENKG